MFFGQALLVLGSHHMWNPPSSSSVEPVKICDEKSKDTICGLIQLIWAAWAAWAWLGWVGLAGLGWGRLSWVGWAGWLDHEKMVQVGLLLVA